MNCRSIIKELANYFDEALDPILKTSIEKHLEGCEDCRIVVDTTRQTIQIFCNAEPAPLPSGVKLVAPLALLATSVQGPVGLSEACTVRVTSVWEGSRTIIMARWSPSG